MRRVALALGALGVAALVIAAATVLPGVLAPASRPLPRLAAASPAVSPPAPAAPGPACAPPPGDDAPAPADIAAALAAFRADPRVAPHAVGASVWLDGLGEVAAIEPDRPLLPASNQKLLTAMGALTVLGPEARLTTELRLGAAGDLVVAAGGDPTLTTSGPHSLDALAIQVRGAGVTRVPGALLVDEARHDGARRAAGWQDWQVPTYAGPLSAFMVDRNRWRRDPAFLADPALANAERLRAALGARGVAVDGPVAYGAAPGDGRTVATVTSAPVVEIVRDMLLRSDNMVAELLLKEVGRAATGVGSLHAGAAASGRALAPLCVPLSGSDDDGSGLSRSNARSAREWRRLVQVAGGAPWWPLLDDGLPLAGRSGTLAGRLRGTAAEANVRAKTGTIIGGVALTGHGTTAGGRAFVFSVVVNGEGAEGAEGAVDALVAAVAGSPA